MKIADTFAKQFAHWNITIPPENLKNRQNGYIQQAGWLIQYCFGKNTIDEYLDYYAAHRMTDDRHIRIHDNGSDEDLPALRNIRLVSKDPEEDKKLEEEYYKYNQEVVITLIEIGLDKFNINMFLHAG